MDKTGEVDQASFASCGLTAEHLEHRNGGIICAKIKLKAPD